MSHRNLEYLHRNRIVYRNYPEHDKPTKSYWWGKYYEDGTYECYELFKSKAKITTYKSLKWHLLVLLYLNPNIDKKNLKIYHNLFVISQMDLLPLRYQINY